MSKSFLLGLTLGLGVSEAFLGPSNVRMGSGSRALNHLQMGQTPVNMPALSSTMTEGKIVSWAKQVGDKVQAGDVLLVVESDKADMDVESYDDGYLAKIYTQEGDSAAVGCPVAVIVDTEAEISSVGDGAGAECVLETKPFDKPTENENEEAPALEGSSSILMPALSSTMTEGKIVSWAKQVGDKVEAGDVLLVVESDKADMDVEAFEDGYLARILVDEDGIAPVGAPVALLAAREADIPAVAAAGATGVGGGGGATSSSSSKHHGISLIIIAIYHIYIDLYL